MIRSAVALSVFASLALAADTRPTFEVASIHPSEGGQEAADVSPGSIYMRNMSLTGAIRWAYSVLDAQVSGPAWLNTTFFDIAAKAGSPANETDMRSMMQVLLANRFKLESHREMKETNAMLLTVRKRAALYLLRPDKCMSSSPVSRPLASAHDAADYALGPGETCDVTDGIGDWERHKLEEKLADGHAARGRGKPGTGDWRFSLPRPDDVVEFARQLGAPACQLSKAAEMQKRGLGAKGRRQALCSVIGSRFDCSDTGCRAKFFRRFGCKCRYCPACGAAAFRALFAKYSGLGSVAQRLSAAKGCVLAKLDFTCRSLGHMPSPAEVKEFNGAIKRFLRIVEREMGISRREYGVLYCNEFGGSNCNLHAHAVWAGPRLPRPKIRKMRRLGKLSLWWRRACAGTVFAGSFIISVKIARSFPAGLGHALKYPSKFLALSNPSRLADLEAAFHGVRRVHCLASFYNALGAPEQQPGSASCPDCGAGLVRAGCWCPVSALEREGRRDVEKARRAAGRSRAFGDARAGPARWRGGLAAE